MSHLTTKDAQAAIETALANAAAVGIPISFAVVDHTRELLGFLRMERAVLGTVEIAMGKAYTACTLESRTGDLAAACQPGGPFFGLETTHHRPLIVFGGGVPIRRGGRVIGAVGISGGSVEQDEMIADAVAHFLENV